MIDMIEELNKAWRIAKDAGLFDDKTVQYVKLNPVIVKNLKDQLKPSVLSFDRLTLAGLQVMADPTVSPKLMVTVHRDGTEEEHSI